MIYLSPLPVGRSIDLMVEAVPRGPAPAWSRERARGAKPVDVRPAQAAWAAAARSLRRRNHHRRRHLRVDRRRCRALGNLFALGLCDRCGRDGADGRFLCRNGDEISRQCRRGRLRQGGVPFADVVDRNGPAVTGDWRRRGCRGHARRCRLYQAGHGAASGLSRRSDHPDPGRCCRVGHSRVGRAGGAVYADRKPADWCC